MREGYRLAEQLLRDYRDPPSLVATVGSLLSRCRQAVLGLYRGLVRD